MGTTRYGKKRSVKLATVVCVMVVVFFCIAGPALASSGGPKKWVATDWYRVLNFTILAVGLFLLLRKPVSNALDARIKGIRDQLGELEEKKRETEQTLSEYQKKLATLDEESKKIISEYVRQGEDAKARILKEAESAAVKLEEQAKRNIENEFSQAKSRLQEEIIEKALVKAETIIREKITSDDQDRIVDDYLKKVVAQ